jgi:hypothetical protein
MSVVCSGRWCPVPGESAVSGTERVAALHRYGGRLCRVPFCPTAPRHRQPRGISQVPVSAIHVSVHHTYGNFFCFPFSHLSVASAESGKSGSSLGKEDLRYVTKLIFFTFIQYCGSDPGIICAAGYMSVFYAHGPSRLMRKCSEILNLSFFV